MGPKHKKKFNEGERINDSYTLLYEFSRPTTSPGKNEWLWQCKCDCGEEFHARQKTLLNRYGCHSCTNKKTSTETAIKKNNGVEHIGLKNRLIKDYKAGAVKRGIEFNLDFDTFIKIVEQPCAYCGEKPFVHEGELSYMQKLKSPWKHLGIDRIDSSRGYTKDNVTSCCPKCNYAKHDMQLDEFKDWVYKAYNKLFNKDNLIVENTCENDETNWRCYPQFHSYRNNPKKN